MEVQHHRWSGALYVDGHFRPPAAGGSLDVRDKSSGEVFAVAGSAEVLVDDRASPRHTVVEVFAKDRPGLLYELTATLSKLNLNIASAHVATFGERAVDVFYVTDQLGAQIVSPTRQAAIKRALIQLLAATPEAAAASAG